MTHSKTLFLFGPGEHFGKELANRFAINGFHIVLVARNKKNLSKLKEVLENQGVSCSILAIDVLNTRMLRQEIGKLAKTIPPVHVAIYNIKRSLGGNVLSVDVGDFSDTLIANVSGALAAIQAVVPSMISGGTIILTGGGYKDFPDPNKLGLSVAKGALHTFFLGSQQVLSEHDIALKTVVIDGAVRNEGPITPEEVAEVFWEAYTGSESILKIDPK